MNDLLKNCTDDEILRWCDRSDPQVKLLAERLEAAKDLLDSVKKGLEDHIEKLEEDMAEMEAELGS